MSAKSGLSKVGASNFRIGTASWTIPKEAMPLFPAEGTHLERYAQTLSGVEINSSFYREHKAATYKKWAASVPKDFKFSVKLSKVFTHTQKLGLEEGQLKPVLANIAELGEKWETLLIQLPPSLAYEPWVAERFFREVREEFRGIIAFEPRHKTWATPNAVQLMKEHSVVKVFADPEPCPLPEDTFGKIEKGPVYFRLHGTPEIYKSNYEAERLQKFLAEIVKRKAPESSAWCIFDNTTFGYATMNALELTALRDRMPGCVSSEKISRAAGPAAM